MNKYSNWPEQLLEDGLPEAIRARAPGDHRRRQANSDQPGRQTKPLRKSRPLAIAWPIASPRLVGPGRSEPVSRRADRLDRFQQRRPGMAGRNHSILIPIFLNLILSMLAALQAPIILMSQKPPGGRATRLAAGLDYEVNLKAEIEIIELYEKLDRILGEHLDELLRTQREQLQLLTQLTPANSNAQ